MNRVVWFTAGAVTGVYALSKARATARNFTPDGLAARAAAMSAGLRALRTEVAAGMAEKEAELRAQLSFPPPRARRAVPTLEAPADARELALARHGREDQADGHR